METPKRPLKNSNLQNVQQQEALGACTPFKIPASPFMKSLGYGTGVNVYFLERSPRSTGQVRSPWAIKRVSQRIRDTNDRHLKIFNERIIKEADILRKLKHPNIVGFRALAKEKDEGVDTLALECCNTSLGSIIEDRLDNGESALPANYIKRMLKDVASALDYLHTDAMLLHGDIKSHNILVKGEFEICKLCDFGVSLPLNSAGMVDFRENPHLEYVGTNVWCAPEVIAEEDVIDTKSDIFSLGLVIYETVTLRIPHTLSISGDDDSEQLDSKEIHESCSDIETSFTTQLEMAFGTRPALPDALNLGDEFNVVMELFYLCTNENSDERPTAKIICEALKSVKDE